MAARILIVDDEPHVRRLIEVNLTRAGYRVEQAENGAQALTRVREDPPDLIVSDVMMPYMDGFAFLRALRSDPTTREIPVVMLTAKATDADVFTGYVEGSTLYLTKPFSPQELLTFLRRILDGRDDDDKRYRLD